MVRVRVRVRVRIRLRIRLRVGVRVRVRVRVRVSSIFFLTQACILDRLHFGVRLCERFLHMCAALIIRVHVVEFLLQIELSLLELTVSLRGRCMS